MKAVITVIGKDTVGILSKVSTVCAEYGANIIDVNQTVMQDLFAMVMLVETDRLTVDLSVMRSALEALGQENNLQIHVM
ncbi:MAG: ACT domain-containing protein, partial [Clostridiales bacterium]|nr:ACT domain-containing protein [Clostridiales bacterium]